MGAGRGCAARRHHIAAGPAHRERHKKRAAAAGRSARRRLRREGRGSMNPRRRSPESARAAHARAIADAPDLRRRGLWLVLAFLAMATAVFGRLIQVQVIQGKSLAAAAAASHTTSITLHASRGVILDRDGRVLVSNVQVFDVFADPALIPAANREQVAGMLAPIL